MDSAITRGRRNRVRRIKPGDEGITLITKWIFEAYAERDSPETPPIGNGVDDASSDGPSLHADPYIDTPDRWNVDSAHTLSQTNGCADEEGCFGGWIVDRRDR